MIMHVVTFKMNKREGKYLYGSLDEARGQYNRMKQNKEYKSVKLTKINI